MRGTPSTSATMFTGNVVCAAVCLNRLFSTICGLVLGAELDHEPGRALTGLVADVADAVDLPGLDQLGELARDRVDARLERHLGEHDRRAASRLLDLVARPHPDRAAAGAVARP